MSDARRDDAELDVEAPNESAPGHHPARPGAGRGERPHEGELDVEAPNESAPGHHPDDAA